MAGVGVGGAAVFVGGIGLAVGGGGEAMATTRVAVGRAFVSGNGVAVGAVPQAEHQARRTAASVSIVMVRVFIECLPLSLSERTTRGGVCVFSGTAGYDTA
jgi:hypothetical protein